MATTPSPVIHISEDTITHLSEQLDTEGQVIVHVSFESGGWDGIRIWPTTYLVPQEGGDKSKLIAAENISLAPHWTILPTPGTYRFTLVFGPLPKSCKVFHLWEDIDQPHGFLVRNIRRNETDVYEVTL